jgi:hypothetical protein
LWSIKVWLWDSPWFVLHQVDACLHDQPCLTSQPTIQFPTVMRANLKILNWTKQLLCPKTKSPNVSTLLTTRLKDEQEREESMDKVWKISNTQILR